MEKAAKLFEAALKSKDLASTLASIEKQQVAAFDEAQKANPTLASLFTEIAKGKTKKKAKAGKGKPFGGKQAPPFKKKSKAKASEGEDGDDETESGLDDSLDPVLDEMTADDLGDDGLDVVDGDDLSLDDLDDVLDDGVEEMPEATAGEGEDDSEEESSDDSEDDKEEESSDESEEESSDDSDDKEGEEESTPAQTAKVKVVASNIAALDRLRKSKTQAGAKKPAK
jgi:hypothetical protein